MAGINKVILVGNLGKDPEIRYTQGGMAVCSFSLATTETYTPRDSDTREEKTEWHQIKAFGRLGEICGEYLSKGRQVYIEGRIQTQDWEDREGKKRRTTEIIANTMQMLGPASQGRGGGGGGGGQVSGSGGGSGDGGDDSGIEPDNEPDSGPAGDDEIPF